MSHTKTNEKKNHTDFALGVPAPHNTGWVSKYLKDSDIETNDKKTYSFLYYYRCSKTNLM